MIQRIRVSVSVAALIALLALPAPVHAADPTRFDISRSSTTYTARGNDGTIHTGTLKSVVERAVAALDARGGGLVQFGTGTFDLGTDYLFLRSIENIEFAGAGMTATTIRNDTSAAADTEPFNMSNITHLVIRDMTVSAGGAPRTTSDALDFDNGNDNDVLRVRITASRGRGMVFDGKGLGWHADGNLVRGCQIDGVSMDGIQFLAASSNRVEGCRITNTGRHGIQMTKASSIAATPDKPSNDNVIVNNIIDQAGIDGINVVSSSRNRITGNQVTNSSDNVASADGIRIGSSGSFACNDNVVEGNTATDTQATKTQRYGLYISSSLCNRTVVGPNDFDGNRVAPIRDLGTGTIRISDPPPSGVSSRPVADTWVDSSAPSSNFGTSATLRIDDSPVRRAYIRFDVQGLPSAPSRVVLRLYATSGSATGYSVRDVSNDTWSETGTTWANAPGIGSAVGSTGSFAAGTWTQVDVTSLVRGNGLHSFAITTTSGTAISFASEESANDPQLVLSP